MKREQDQPINSEPSSDNQNQIKSNKNSQKQPKNEKLWKSQQSLNIKFNAIIRSGFFPQFQTLSIFYTIKNGKNWKKVSGQNSGMSQMSSSPEGKIIWNFPIQISYETDYLVEPPQIAFVMYGHDFLGRSIPKAYGNIHFPLSSGSQRRKIKMFKMNQLSVFSRMYSFFTGSYYELKQVQKVLDDPKQRAYLKTKICGQIQIQFQTKRFNFQKYGYDN